MDGYPGVEHTMPIDPVYNAALKREIDKIADLDVTFEATTGEADANLDDARPRFNAFLLVLFAGIGVLLAMIGFQSSIATKAARVVKAALGRDVVEFGTRRAHSPTA